MTSVESNTCWTGTASTHGTNSTNTATATCTTVKTEAEIVPSETKTNIQIQGNFPTRSTANTVLFLNNNTTTEGIKFMVNAPGGAMNSTV